MSEEQNTQQQENQEPQIENQGDAQVDSQKDSGAEQDSVETQQIIEGLLMAAGRPLPLNKIADVFEEDARPDADALKAALEKIQEDCGARGFELKQVASGYRFQVKQKYSQWVSRLWEEKPQKYSRALLETISIIAYRQPITRGEIEKIRGVAVSTNIIRTLMDREWVRVVGHRDVPGRPAMFATTRQFLDYFNLKSLEELPPLAEIRDLEELDPELSLEDEAPESRVLEFPSAEDLEDTFDVLDEEEERAAAVGTRPIEEILGIEEEEPAEDWDDDSEEDSEEGNDEGSKEVSEEGNEEDRAQVDTPDSADSPEQDDEKASLADAGISDSAAPSESGEDQAPADPDMVNKKDQE